MNLEKLCGFETMCFDTWEPCIDTKGCSGSAKTLRLKIEFEDGSKQELTVPVSSDENGHATASIIMSRHVDIRNLM